MMIFLIDDDRLSMFLTQSILVLEGFAHEIYSFCSAEEALEVLGSGGNDAIPDIIFLDLNMPDMDGWGFLDTVMATQLNIEIKKRCSLYILTSSLDLSDTKRSKEYPLVSGLLHKPLKSEDIKIIFSQQELLFQNILM